ncbi:tyrosine-type recombinase/integrase [Peteryoungia ipomoeae]|uniref:Tyr recombinase domain-containing protein n=1 Tax=Peteryoungia ipomoeae TaxID=1210932 RepID=A0A4V4HN78_9HYPH|nr:tyrosine-type recombinase/integrase [Peteryoungia ipomoeae]THV25076.1 hypothetical protein FAA97_02400 [Peteryoungia ipomoeae]
MTVLMPSLSRAKNGDWFARKVIPSDVRDDYQSAFGVRQEERFRKTSLLTATQAKAEFAGWVADVEGRIATLRAAQAGGAQKFSTRQMHALIGRWYDWFVLQHEQSFSVEEWDFRYGQLEDAVEKFGGLSPSDDEELSPRHKALIRAKVLELSQLPTFMAQEGLKLDSHAQDELLDRLKPDLIAVMALLRRRAGGNYAPDEHRKTLPRSSAETAPTAKLAGWSPWEAFEAWVKERQPEASTINRWRGVFVHLNDHVESRDVALITEEDAVAWKDKLLQEGNAGGRTINEVWLTAARRVFNWVKAQKRLSANPFDGLKVAVPRSTSTKGEFSDADAETILKATLEPQPSRRNEYLKAARRWVPWLCAYTGSRPGEMTQLRKEDVELHKNGFWMIHIRTDAGTVKGNVSRTVVMHEHLVEQGFIEFVRRSGTGPLFYNPASASKKEDDPLNPKRPMYVQLRQKLGDWVRELGVTDKDVSPNHAWRHTFKRRAARAKIEQRLRDAFCGHSSGTVGSIYERPSIEDLADAIKDFPRYPVEAA